MTAFEPKKSLLNPKFEGYKLAVMDAEDAVMRHSLPYHATQATSSGKTPLSFQEMQSRITHNHLSIDAETNQAVYVDSEHRIILTEFNGDTPSYRILYEMPLPVQSEATATIHREYPSAMFIGSTLVIASDGDGSLYVLSVKNEGLSTPVGTYVLASEGRNTPFKIHYSHRSTPTSVVTVISSKSSASLPKESSRRPGGSSLFDVRAIRINLLSLGPNNTEREMDVIWTRQGEDIPIFTPYVPSLDSHILVGGSNYPDPTLGISAPYVPSADEIAPIPRANENPDKSDDAVNPPPPPYSWTQTPDSVTIAIPLPSATSKDNIRVLFSPKSLTVHVNYFASTSTPIPRYSSKELWDTVSPSSSFWTWDKEAERAYGVLTLHMEKQNEGTRWMQVFATSGDNDDVPETLDPSELYKISESLEKYTASLRDGSDSSGLGLGAGLPSLASGEIDDEVDASVGRQAYLTWVAASNGSTPTWFDPREQVPFTLLATTLPGLKEEVHDLSLVVKNNLDGLVFGLEAVDGEKPVWTHASTYPAVAFVLASKRDTRFTYLVPSKAILAFESAGQNRGGNLYIYRRPSATKDKWAKQSILKVDDGQGGSLLGVGAITGKDGELRILCLLERELVTIKGI
ncbi:hypothetical protein D9611_009417 [Ephemerocybe angulata]|uniref:NudC domain-containing protein 1 n=1 Tax=Ephemerocybe angulata TaxID=980116 RepID=A0A8H5ETB5_9AGAR|nr:hypothetical protein D9611_009417 [Tulosesus angulatus]